MIMSHQHWISRTKRNFHGRSASLRAVDSALRNYHRNTSIRTATALFNALKTWIENKRGRWKASIRNSKIETDSGKGTVETLLDQIIAQYAQFRPTAAPFIAQSAAPPPPPMVHGNKAHQMDEDGGHHIIPIQVEENSCGPACVRQVIKLVSNEDHGEDFIRALVEQAEEGGAYGGSLGGGGVVSGSGNHNWGAGGGGTWLVPAALTAAKIENSTNTNPSTLLQSSKKRPAIGVVRWTNGGLHYVVVAGRSRKGNLIVLDPYYGVQHVPVSGANPGPYNPTDKAGRVQVNGVWYPWVCLTK